MIQALLTKDWNADPNAPEVKLSVDNTAVTLDFYVNAFQFDSFQEGDKARVTFLNCHKYSFNTMNEEGYYKGKYRYNNFRLPWGEFYRLDTNWQIDFPNEKTVLIEASDVAKQNHFIFFFKDNTFECVAEDCCIEFIQVSLSEDLIDIIEKVKEKTTDSSDMVWTKYDNAKEIRDELDTYIRQLQKHSLESLDKLYMLFLPTASLQEHATTNDWAEEYLDLSAKFDKLYAKRRKPQLTSVLRYGG